jgi:PAS domain S-box-containing protein
MSAKEMSLPTAIDPLAVSHAVLEASRDAIIIVDARARITMMNCAAEEVTGWRAADARGCRVADVCHLTADAAESIPLALFAGPCGGGVLGDRDPAMPAATPNVTVDGRATLHPRNARPIRVAHSTTPVVAADGSIDGAVLVLRVQPEEDRTLLGGIGQSEYCRRILEAEPACVKVVGPDGSLVDMNAAGLAMLEADSLGEAQRQPLIEFLAPAHRSAFGALHRKVMQGDSGTLEFEVVGLRGTARWLDTQAVPLRDSQGKVAALLGVTRDITERRQADQALRDSERRYHTLSNMVPVGIFQTDASGATTYLNPHFCHLAGLRPEDPACDNWLRAVHPDDLARVQEGWRAASSGQQIFATEYRLLRPDGEIVWVLATARPEQDLDGRFIGYIGTITDVTARLHAEFVLEAQNRVLEMIAKGAPLRDTLTTLLRFVEDQAPGMLSSILLLDPDGIHVRHGAAPSLPEAYLSAVDGLSIGESAGSCGTAAYRRRPVIVEDIATDPLWADYKALASAHGLRACWSTPILDVHGGVLGTFAIYFREPRRPQEQHERLIQLTISLAALAIGRHHEETALRASEAGLAAAQSRARLGSWELDLSTMIGTWSAEMFRLFDWNVSLGPPSFAAFLELTHPADRRRLQEAHRDVVSARVPGTVEFRANPERGPLRWFRGNLDPIVDDAGRVTRLAGTTLDVTETRRAEEELRKVNRELRMLSGVSQALVRSTDEQQLLSRFCQIVAGTAPYGLAAVGERDESMPAGIHIVTRTGDGSEAVDGLIEDLAPLGGEAIRTGEVVRHRLGPPAGVAFPLRTGGETSSALLIRSSDEHGFDESEMALVGELAGDLAFGIHTLRTRTAHRVVQEALAQSEARFRATFEQAAVGVAHVAPDGRFIRVNRRLAEITGYSSEALATLTFGEITHADDLPADAQYRARLLSGEVSTYNIEQRFLRKGGGAVWANITTSLVTQESGEPGYFITVVEDITTKRNLEGQLRQSQKMEAIGLLAGGVAHEFNNMLSVILGNAELSLGELQETDTLRENLQAIVEAANRGADITRQLLAFARKETTSPVVLDVNARLTSLTRMISRLSGEDVSLETKFDSATWPIKLDPTQFDQVIVNLVTNARDAIRGVGTITLETRNVVADAAYRSVHRAVASGEYVAVRITDTGVGMDAVTLDQIFQPFFTTKALGKGTGLGLPVVLGISQRAGGHVLVESTPGKGARFTLLFPRSREAVQAPARVRKIEPGLAGSETILLVEDELALLALTRRSLESYGYRVLPASSPGDALLIAQSHDGEIALLLTDVVMPMMNGRELYERVSAIRRGIRVVYMSGYPADIVARRGELDHSSVYVQKPFVLATLARSVRRALE